jgi:hypothetical protein
MPPHSLGGFRFWKAFAATLTSRSHWNCDFAPQLPKCLVRCFFHAEQEALAVCRMCGRGLCKECGQPVGRSLACPGECATSGVDYERSVDEWLKNNRQRWAQSEVLAEQTIRMQANPSSLPEVNVKAPAPTMSERAAAHREVIALSSQNPKPIRRLHRRNAFSFFCIGSVLMVWGLFDPARLVLALLAGAAFVCAGVWQLARSSPSIPIETQSTNSAPSERPR